MFNGGNGHVKTWVPHQGHTFQGIHERFWCKYLHKSRVDTTVAIQAFEHTDIKRRVNASQQIDLEAPRLLGLKDGSFLIRDEYKRCLAKLTDIHAANPWGGAVLTGQAGIGKSIFLFYVLVNRLSQGKATVISDNEGTLLFNKNGVFDLNPRLRSSDIRDLESGDEAVWALIDRNGPPPYHLVSVSSPFFPVHITSPDPALYADWSDRRGATTVYMNPWTHIEVVVGAVFQRNWASKIARSPSTLSKDLWSVYYEYSPSPRDVYSLQSTERRSYTIDSAIRCMSLDTLISLHNLGAYRNPAHFDKFRHLIVVERAITDSVHEDDHAKTRIVSPSVLKKIIHQLGAHTLSEQRQVFRALSRHAQCSITATWLFREMTLDTLSGKHLSAGKRRMTRLNGARAAHNKITFSSGKSCEGFEGNSVIVPIVQRTHNEDVHAVVSSSDIYSSHISGVDAFFVTDTEAYVFQSTTRRASHPLSREKLEDLHVRFGSRTAKFVLVVPDDGREVSLDPLDHDWVKDFEWEFYVMRL